MTDNLFNIDKFKCAIDDVLEISSPTEASKSFLRYLDKLGEDEKPAARALFVAMVDPNIRFGLSFVKMARTSSLNHMYEIHPDYILDLIDLGRPLKKNNAAIKTAWFDVAGLIDQLTLEWLAQALDKKIKMRIGKKIISGMFPGHIKLFDVMLAHKFREKGVKYPVSVEPKIDGIRCITVCSIDSSNTFSVEFFTRTGKPIESVQKNKNVLSDLEELCREMMADHGHKELILDSEVTAGDFNGTSSEIRRASKEAKNANLCIFDILPPGFLTFGKDRWGEAGVYAERREILVDMFGKREFDTLYLNKSYFANSVEEIFQFYNSFRESGLEGAIVKDRHCDYERKRSYGWMKIKANDSADLIVIGAFEGEGKYEGMLGGLIVDMKGVQVRVGGGFSDDQRGQYWEMFKRDSMREPAEDMELIGGLAEVNYHEVTPDGSLRHPVFKTLRWDKNEANF